MSTINLVGPGKERAKLPKRDLETITLAYAFFLISLRAIGAAAYESRP